MMNKTQEIVELSGWQFSALVLLSGVFSPIILMIDALIELIRRMF